MSRLPNSLARAPDFQHFAGEPLDFLRQARRTHGDLFVIQEKGPLFSRISDCAGVIAVFGTEHQRTVLGNIELFGMPISAAQHLRLPPRLAKLNRSLHSMRGDEHTVQKRCLAGLLTNRSIEAYHSDVAEAFEEFAPVWSAGRTFGLLAGMRRLMFHVASRVLFGQSHESDFHVASLLQNYFYLRRDAASPFQLATPESRKQLLAAGRSLDLALRTYVRECRKGVRASSAGLIARLATLEIESKRRLSEDEVVGHSNILFVSATEPIAVALTWILLVLSQLPAWRKTLRNEVRARLGTNEYPTMEQLGKLTLLDGVINETLRLLPPNAFMVRITTEPVSLNGVQLPARCEVVLCPFLAHRDNDCFPRPNEFRPGRWKGPPPSPFAYFPFGAGGHSCVGKGLATYLIKTALAFLLPRHDFILAGDQQIDWRVNIMLTPRSDPAVRVRSRHSSARMRPGRLGGQVRALLNLKPEKD
jgi:cytochrome P450